MKKYRSTALGALNAAVTHANSAARCAIFMLAMMSCLSIAMAQTVGEIQKNPAPAQSAANQRLLAPVADNQTSINQPNVLATEDPAAAQEEALLKSVVRSVPNDVESWFRLANLYARFNRGEEAASAYQRTLLLDNSHSRAWHNLSVVRLRQSFAAMLQAQLTVDSKDPLASRVESLIQEMNKLSLIETPKPAVSTNAVSAVPANEQRPASAVVAK